MGTKKEEDVLDFMVKDSKKRKVRSAQKENIESVNSSK